MRRQWVSWIFAGFFGLCATPFVATAGPEVGATAEGVAAAVPVGVERAADTGVRDEAAMVLVGTALLGIAAAVRRAH